ncbi:uncharacterized protein LOC117183100 isoform X2 [Belonocnema kinseyi]|uniref:uncharacterized protein LOC117183100 isoform X2 n=1 Tax=Belonocnema kinseyi TaxID=2817044 RepID=UPI00143D2AFE|nr:uncharacterized protein LOC117183100 isoform X2 [Belonocnema kinseyi]
MSECDNPDEHCETSRVREEKAMGDVHDEHTEDDSYRESPSPECPRQEADGAPESSGDEPSPIDTPSSDSVELQIAENCESLNNTTMQERNGIESIEALAEDCKDSSETSSDDAFILPLRARDPCRCEMCRVKRRILMEEMERALRLNSLWTDLRKHIHSVFHAAMTASSVPNSLPSPSDSSRQSNLQNTVVQLCKSDPHQLSMRLVSQAQEFVVEVKVQLLTLLHNQRINHLAEIFLTRMLDGYDALISTALQISELVKPVETEYFQKFNLTWESFNKKLYQDYVYTDPLIQNKLPPFIGQLRKLLPLKGPEYQGLVHRYLAFDDEMTRIVNLWPEAVQLIDKHNMEQAARIVKLRRFREGWETFTTWWKQVQQQETYKRHERLQEANNQLGKESQEGVVANGSNGRVPSPVCLLDTLSIPPKHDIAQFLLDAKTSHQRLVDVLKSIIVSKDHLTVKDYGINMPNHPNMNDLEFQCGYECASTLIQSFATLIANRRNKGKCSENHSDTSLVIDEENCTYCTLSPLLNSNLFMVKELSMEEESSHSKDKLFPPFNNDIAGMAKRIASNFSAIKDLYNQVSSAMPCECPEVVTPQAEWTNPNLNAIDEPKLLECETESAQPKESRSNCVAEDVDFRKLDFQSCPCVYQHTKDIAEKRKEVDNPPCPCLLNSKRKLDTCPCLKNTPSDGTSNGHSEVQPPATVHPKSDQEPPKPVMKTSCTNSAQTQTRHSTTQTRNTPHHHNRTARQGSTHSQDVKTAASVHKAHSHGNQSSVACHKQHVVEHIKRVSCSDLSPGDGDCSDSGSSHEDSCSTSSSSPRDSNRHCDCCYCEVFGHGVPSVAPVSRNYNEMRDRLRQLLTKKKATKCKAACSPPKSPAESLPSNANSESKTPTSSSHSAPRSNTPLSTASTVLLDNRDQRDLDSLLEFIEGGQNGKRDNKKAEKKARQKQRKIEDKLKQERLEEERQKLIEIRKKTPEVTITVVDPQRPMPHRLQSHRNLPEVSILPASSPIVLTALKQCNIKNKKKDKYEAPSNISVSSKSNAKTKGVAHTNQKIKGPVSVDRVDGVFSSNQSSKNSIKTEKVSNNKVNKAQNKSGGKKGGKVAAPPPAPPTPPPPEPIAIDESLLTKKERKKLRRERRKLEEAKQETDNHLQIVTIKRVMESSSAEPTVTITLKGQTPAQDKVLFTLVNGQTKESTKSDQGQSGGGKKKKNKGKNNNNSNTNNSSNNNNSNNNSNSNNTNNSKVNNSNQTQQNNKLQQSNVKQQQQAKGNDNKNVKQQTGNEKTKSGKQVEPLKLQQQASVETKATKSKKDKKNTENKENVSQQQNSSNKNKNQQQNQQQNLTSKKQNKVNSSSQIQLVQKQTSLNNAVVDKKTKTQQQQHQQQQQQQQQNKNNQTNAKKNNKNVNSSGNNNGNNNTNNNANNKSNTNKTDNKKNQSKVQQNSGNKQQRPLTADVQSGINERVSSPFSSQFKDISASSKINIENLKLPPGITITKVDTPARSLPVKTTPKPKPPNPPKQTTIIAAPMNSAQSAYANQQNGGNVIVVDTGKLKQDLMPKSTDKDASKENQSGKKKKKKKKNKNSVAQNGPSSTHVLISQNKDHSEDTARILHNPQTNMVTIRNPAFGPPKMEAASQQAAIIKVSENGMVTIRSPALQQAINAGLTPPPKPDFIIKGDLTGGKSSPNNSNPKHTNGIIPSSLAELRSRLTPDCTSLSDLANIQISKVTSGQPIPENGINIKGTSVTLTKVRNPDPMIDEVQQAKTAVREAINASMAAAVSSSGGGGGGKGKKKKKRGNGARQSGDDWNLVESVFTPKDIDLEDGDMDDAERELEAFKRFCLQSVPPPRKEKVNLNIKDIVLKKKSSSSSTAAAIAAN